MGNLSSFRIFRVTVAFAVALWMGGAGCLLGCENLATASTHAPQPGETTSLVVTGETCSKHRAKSKGSETAASPQISKHQPESKVHGTAKAKATLAHSGIAAPVFSATPSPMMDCPLAVDATAALSKATPDNAHSAPSLANEYRPETVAFEKTAALAPPLRLPNRGHTYLQCCVFLI